MTKTMKRNTALALLAFFGVVAVMGASLISIRPSAANWPQLATAETPSVGLSLSFLGTSSLSISDGKDRLLIDGYFSRPGILPLLLKRLEPDEARIDHALERAQINQVSALLVAHSHFDHALDAIPIAQRFGARLMGGETLRQLALRHPANLPVEVFTPPQAVQVGTFRITPILTPHAPGDVAKGATAAGFTIPRGPQTGPWARPIHG